TGDFLQTILLATAMFALGCGVNIQSLRNVGARPFVLACASTVLVATIALIGIEITQVLYCFNAMPTEGKNGWLKISRPAYCARGRWGARASKAQHNLLRCRGARAFWTTLAAAVKLWIARRFG